MKVSVLDICLIIYSSQPNLMVAELVFLIKLVSEHIANNFIVNYINNSQLSKKCYRNKDTASGIRTHALRFATPAHYHSAILIALTQLTNKCNDFTCKNKNSEMREWWFNALAVFVY